MNNSLGQIGFMGQCAYATCLKPLKMVGRAGFEPATNWLKANLSKLLKRRRGAGFSVPAVPFKSICTARKSLYLKGMRFIWDSFPAARGW